MKNDKVSAVVSYEPAAFVFPEGEAPAPIPNKFAELAASTAPMDDFMKLTKIPIVVYFSFCRFK